MQIDGPSLQCAECLAVSETSAAPEAAAGANPERAEKLQTPKLKSSKITRWFSFQQHFSGIEGLYTHGVEWLFQRSSLFFIIICLINDVTSGLILSIGSSGLQNFTTLPSGLTRYFQKFHRGSFFDESVRMKSDGFSDLHLDLSPSPTLILQLFMLK